MTTEEPTESAAAERIYPRGVNPQVVASPDGTILGVSGDLRSVARLGRAGREHSAHLVRAQHHGGA